MSREVVGYWHSKDSTGSQSEAESIVMGFADRGIHVDVLVLDYKYKTCDGCTAFNSNFPDPKGMVANFKKNGTHVMAHVNVEQNFSDPTFVGGQAFLDNNWTTMQRSSEGELVPLCRSGVGHLMPGQPLPASDFNNNTCRYDPFIPEARAALWNSVNDTLVAAGVHMFWLDGDEIIGEDPWETPTAPLGPQIWGGDHDSNTMVSTGMTVPREDPYAGANSDGDPSCPATCDKSLPTANCPLVGVDYNGGDVAHADAANATICCSLCHGRASTGH
jgi:alpha-glucosidase (family GH31 glycosyl hydrolase)